MMALAARKRVPVSLIMMGLPMSAGRLLEPSPPPARRKDFGAVHP
jgi:hypothetical protein